jgi:hypothetical protein
MQNFGYQLVPGSKLIGGTAETNNLMDVWCVANSSTQALQILEKLPADNTTRLLAPASTISGTVNTASANAPSSPLPSGVNYETFTTGASDITDTGTYTVFSAKGSGTHHYITSIVGTNSSTTDTVLYVEDGSTIIATINCKSGGGFVFNPAPYLLQATANAAINIVARTTGSALQITAIGYWK